MAASEPGPRTILSRLRSLAKEFSTEAAGCLGSRVYAVWLAGSVARGDFDENVSDLDLEMILKIGEEKKRTTRDMDELRDLSDRYDSRARQLGASGLDCFVFRLNDLKPRFHILQLGLFGEAMYGPPPREVISVETMEKDVGRLAMEFIHEAAANARDGLEGKAPLYDIERGVEVIVNTENQPAIVFNAREVPKAANFAAGKGVWRRPGYLKRFSETFPAYRQLVDEIWEYRFDQSKLRAKGKEYIENFLQRCAQLPIDLEEQLAKEVGPL